MTTHATARPSRGTPSSPSLLANIRDASAGTLVTAPAVYVLTLPLAFLDLCVTVYQWVCFPVYGIAVVPRRRYFAFDRHKLPYLNLLERANCAYCSYANGVLAYTREIAARTETYWCPIKHARRVRDAHRHYRAFFAYGDGRAYRRGLMRARRRVMRRHATDGS